MDSNQHGPKSLEPVPADDATLAEDDGPLDSAEGADQAGVDGVRQLFFAADPRVGLSQPLLPLRTAVIMVSIRRQPPSRDSRPGSDATDNRSGHEPTSALPGTIK